MTARNPWLFSLLDRKDKFASSSSKRKLLLESSLEKRGSLWLLRWILWQFSLLAAFWVAVLLCILFSRSIFFSREKFTKKKTVGKMQLITCHREVEKPFCTQNQKIMMHLSKQHSGPKILDFIVWSTKITFFYLQINTLLFQFLVKILIFFA